MKQFRKAEQLKQVALMAIAVQSDPNDIMELKQIFQALDKDNNGNITLQELQAGLGDRENAEELIEILKGADTDESGTINYTGKYLSQITQTSNIIIFEPTAKIHIFFIPSSVLFLRILGRYYGPNHLPSRQLLENCFQDD